MYVLTDWLALHNALCAALCAAMTCEKQAVNASSPAYIVDTVYISYVRIRRLECVVIRIEDVYCTYLRGHVCEEQVL